MFSIEQIRAAHSKVKSGADFPAYIKAIKAMGVTHYETFVADGHTEYYGENDFKAVAPGKYEPIFVFDTCNRSVQNGFESASAREKRLPDVHRPVRPKRCGKMGSRYDKNDLHLFR